ncbi:mitochondrial protein Pet127-domain-containing protein [Aspergillus karnatakaensis]|uniref:Pet127 family protein n=1 Tax=Aspergillus karnatakaensis TaxID=1810916 RepID=UPI003CCDBA7F
MFRSSLRSVSDPLRGHVCISCLARISKRPSQARLSFGTSQSRAALPGAAWNRSASSQPLENVLGVVADSPKSLETTTSETSEQHDSNSAHAATPGGESEEVSETTSETSPKKVSSQRNPGFRLGGYVKKNSTRKIEPFKHERTKEPRAALPRGVHSRYRGQFLNTKHHRLKPVLVETPSVPRLSFGLDRVLFNPGVYHLRDRRTRVYNFDPYLGSIMPVTEFDFTALKDYITSSKDNTLRDVAVKHGKKYIGSSSSMTGVLSHFHYLLSAWRPVNFNMLSQSFPEHLTTFTRLSRAPAAMFLRYQNGTYAIDADKEFDSANILMNLGKSMEKLLTMPKEEYERYRRSHDNKITREEEALVPESYHYTKFGGFMMRSQLDSYDPRLPGTGMFDLKTRAVVSIRMDVLNFEKGLGYQIKKPLGKYESFEREYYDMIRSAFLKYSLQVRIGRMDGIFVAFHNIEKIFGFQYISLPEMDHALHGTSNQLVGDMEFRLSLQLWNKILDRATSQFPKQNIRFHFETLETKEPEMQVFYEPVTDEEIDTIQTKNQKEIDAYQRRVLSLQDAPEDETDIPDTGPEPTGNTGETSGMTLDDFSNSPSIPERPIRLLNVKIKNRLDGKLVERVTKLRRDQSWTVDYGIDESAGPHVRRLYDACVDRRKTFLMAGREDVPEEKLSYYIQTLRKLSRQGRKDLKLDQTLDEKLGTVVFKEGGDGL